MSRHKKRETVLRLSDQGVTVRVFRRKGFAPLQLEVEERYKGRPPKKERRSFGHTDEQKARQDAAAVFSNLLKTSPGPLSPNAPLTLAQVVERYLTSAAFAATKQRTMVDRRSVLRFVVQFEDWSVRPAIHLGQEDVLRYFHARTHGLYRRDAARENVSKRRAQSEVQMLRTALNWAYTTRENGRRLISERVFDGLLIPGGGTPTQPSMTVQVFAALWSVRHELHPAFGAALALALAYGKRGESIRHVQWIDINWTEHLVFWNPEHDKEEQAGLFWLPPDLEAVLKEWWEHPERPNTRWVFGAPKNPDEPITRVSFQQWMNRAYKKAGLVKPRQGGWHSLRRWFTTRNSGEDAKAAMKLAGMRNVSTFFRYQQPEEASLKRVLTNRPALTNG